MPAVLSSERDRETLRSFAHRIDAGDAGAHNNLGVLYFKKGMTAEAVAEFTRALELDSRMTIAQRNLEIAYFNSGYYDARLQELRAQLEASPRDRAARWELGRTYALLGDTRQAADAFGAAAPRRSARRGRDVAPGARRVGGRGPRARRALAAVRGRARARSRAPALPPGADGLPSRPQRRGAAPPPARRRAGAR